MAKGAPKLSPYSDGIDLPFSDEEEQEEENVDKQNFKPLDASITDELKMHEKDLLASHADERFFCVGSGKGTSKECISEDNMYQKDIDVLFFEEDTVGDGDRTAVEAVVSTNEELSKLLKEVETLQNSASAFSCEEEGDHDNDDDAGNKLELYKKWQFMGSYAAEAQVLVPLEEKKHGLSHMMDSFNPVFTKIIHLHDLKLHFYCDLDEKPIKAAKRRGNWIQPKFVAAKEKNKANGKVDDDESLSCGS
ncbi:unnamed protein product [Prunus armeniaca]|uniref:Uncharacterized protein n=2 Tax=Prunus armeniaca TaxID=36596 RepID=A0A6J5WE93_PRUAR|nr:unnamed protein product [Prunus armeniaca]